MGVICADYEPKQEVSFPILWTLYEPPLKFLRSEERRVGKSVDLGGRRIIKKKKKNKYKKKKEKNKRTTCTNRMAH